MSLVADTVDLHDLSAQVYRAGSGSPLVWLHAANGVQPGDPFVEALAQAHEVIAPLAPGFNDVEELDAIRDVHDLAMYYDDLFEKLGLDGVPVAGHSFGGMIAAELASHYPKRASKLVLVAPVGLWNDAYPVADLFGIPATELNDLVWGDKESPAAQMAYAMAANAVDPLSGGTPEQVEAYVDMLLGMVKGLTSVAKFMWPLPDKGLARRLHRITAPTLVLWGEGDKLTPVQYADDFARLIPGAQKRTFPVAGHMLPLERPEEMLQAINEFLAS